MNKVSVQMLLELRKVTVSKLSKIPSRTLSKSQSSIMRTFNVSLRNAGLNCIVTFKIYKLVKKVYQQSFSDLKNNMNFWKTHLAAYEVGMMFLVP